MAANVQLRTVDGSAKHANNRGVITDEPPLPDVSGNDNGENLDPKAPHSQNPSWCLSLLKQYPPLTKHHQQIVHVGRQKYLDE